MKKLLFFIFLILGSSINAQLRSTWLDSIYIDTIYMFDPKGAINFNSKSGDRVSEVLTISFSEELKTIFAKQFSPTTFQFCNINSSTDSLYLMSFYYRLDNISIINKKCFDTLSIHLETLNLLAGRQGRFFAVAFFEGYVQQNYTQKLVGSISLGLATLVLSMGSFYYFYLPKEPFASVKIVLIDRQNNRFLYFGSHRISSDPMHPKTIEKIVSEFKKEIVGKNKR